MSVPARANRKLPAANSGAIRRRSEFLPAILQLQEEAPSPLPRLVLWTVVGLVGVY